MVEGRIVALDSVLIRATGDQPILTGQLQDGRKKRIVATKWALTGCRFD
jgi:hypothetical protein